MECQECGASTESDSDQYCSKCKENLPHVTVVQGETSVNVSLADIEKAKSDSTSMLRSQPLYVLKHPWWFLASGIVCIGMVIAIIVISTTQVSPWGDVSQTVAFIGMVAVFSLLGIGLILEALRANILVFKEGFIAKAPWPWYPREIRWNEIANISYSSGLENYVIHNIDGTQIRISKFYRGIANLTKLFEKHLVPEAYEEVSRFFKH